jgi:hypothetical protein
MSKKVMQKEGFLSILNVWDIDGARGAVKFFDIFNRLVV